MTIYKKYSIIVSRFQKFYGNVNIKNVEKEFFPWRKLTFNIVDKLKRLKGLRKQFLYYIVKSYG